MYLTIERSMPVQMEGFWPPAVKGKKKERITMEEEWLLHKTMWVPSLLQGKCTGNRRKKVHT